MWDIYIKCLIFIQVTVLYVLCLYFRILNKLENVEELKIPFPEKNMKDCIDSEYISKCMEKLSEKVEGKYNLLEFYFTMCVDDPEIAIILSIIDEGSNEKEMQKMIFSDEVKYIGVNYKKIEDNKSVIYMVFAK